MFTSNNIIDAIILFIKLFMVMLFFYKFLSPKYKNITYYVLPIILVLFTITLINKLLSPFREFSSENVLYLITALLLFSEILVFFIYLHFLFKDTLALKICALTIYVIYNISAMQLAGSASDILFHENTRPIFESPLSYELIYITVFSVFSILLRKINIPKNIKFSSRDIIVIMLPIVVYIVPFAFYLMPCAFLFVIVYVIQKIAKENTYVLKESLLQNQLSSQTIYISSILDSQKRIKRIQHDMNNHLNCIKNMLISGKTDEALDYLTDISASITQSQLSSSTGHPAIDAVLSEKYILAQKSSIKLIINSMLLKDIHIKAFDIAVILFNSIDNAINYIIKTPSIANKEISIDISKRGNYVLIKVSNPINDFFIKKSKKIKNLKYEFMSKGLGLSNMELTVQKYNGNLELLIENNTFNLIAILECTNHDYAYKTDN